MAGLDPAIHVIGFSNGATWMPGSSPGMTMRKKGAAPYSVLELRRPITRHMMAQSREDDRAVGRVDGIVLEGFLALEGGLDAVMGVAFQQPQIPAHLHREDARDDRGQLLVSLVDLALLGRVNGGRILVGHKAEMADHGWNLRCEGL